MKIKFAYFFSRITDPGYLYALLLLIAIWLSPLKLIDKLIWASVLESFILFIPLIIFFRLVKKGKLSDIDITNPKERNQLFYPVSILWLIALIITYLAKLPIIIYSLVIIGVLTVSIWSLITPFYKISAHLAGITSLVVYSYYVLDIATMIWFGPILICFVAWLRLVQKKHTLGQVIFGAIISFIISKAVIQYLF